MSKATIPSAADVLPKALVTKLQRHCSGTIYIPLPQTQAQRNAARVWFMHTRGWKPVQIAESVEISVKQVREIIRDLEDGGTHSRVECKIHEMVPQEIVEAVQKYVFGRIYVPGKASQATRRQCIVKRLLRKGLPVSEIAKRSGLSERRVRQMKKAETELAQSEAIASKSGVDSGKLKRRDRFEVGPVVEPGYVPIKRCSICGLPVGPDDDRCDVCMHRAEAKREADSDVIILRDFPFAVINRQF